MAQNAMAMCAYRLGQGFTTSMVADDHELLRQLGLHYKLWLEDHTDTQHRIEGMPHWNFLKVYPDRLLALLRAAPNGKYQAVQSAPNELGEMRTLFYKFYTKHEDGMTWLLDRLDIQEVDCQQLYPQFNDQPPEDGLGIVNFSGNYRVVLDSGVVHGILWGQQCIVKEQSGWYRYGMADCVSVSEDQVRGEFLKLFLRKGYQASTTVEDFIDVNDLTYA